MKKYLIAFLMVAGMAHAQVFPPSGGATISSSATINAANGQVQADSVVGTTYYSMSCFGDSHVGGFGAFATPMCPLIASDLNMPTPSNYAAGGDNAADLAWHMFTSLNPSDMGNSIVVSNSDVINSIDCGQTADCFQQFAQNEFAANAWGLISSTKKTLFPSNYSVVLTGTTSTDTTFANANGVKCTAGPCTMTYSFIVGQPGVVYLWYVMNSTGGTISVTIDGASVADTVTGLNSVSTAWTRAPANNTSTVGMARYPASATSPGTHTIVVTASTNAIVIGMGFPTTLRTRGVSAPRVLMGNAVLTPIRTAANTTAYNNAFASIEKQLVADGLNAPLVDLYNSMNYNLDFTSTMFTGSQSGTTMTVSAMTSGTIVVGQTVYPNFNPTPLGIVTAQLTGATGGVGTYTLTTSATVTSGTLAQNTQACYAAENTNHPNDCGHTNLAHAFESVIGAGPVLIGGSLNTTKTTNGPMLAISTNSNIPASTGGFTSFGHVDYSPSLIPGIDICPRNTNKGCGLKFLQAGDTGYGTGIYDTTAHGVGFYASATFQPTADAQFYTVFKCGTATSSNVCTIYNGGLAVKAYAFSTLPSASTMGAGAMVVVTDCTTYTVGATCTGGGSDVMMAVSNGTSWSFH